MSIDGKCIYIMQSNCKLQIEIFLGEIRYPQMNGIFYER